MFDYEHVKNCMGDLEEDALLEDLKAVMDAGGADAGKAMEAMQEGMNIVGSRFESGEYFVGDLIYAGEVMTMAMDIIRPALAVQSGSGLGRMILCTVKDDLHDIGKNIVKAILEAGGFEVLDLGIDVAPETVVQKAQEEKIRIIALSGVLTLALDSMKATVEAFRDAGMRDSVKIIIGGAPVSEEACQLIGADEWAYSPQKTLNTCKAWAAEMQDGK